MMRYLLLMLCLLVPSLTHAETIDARLAKADPCGRFEVIHINGIMTSLNGANDNLTRLRVEYGNAHNGHVIWYALAYNQTRGLPADFYDSFQQVARDFAGATFADWIQNVVFGITKSTMTSNIAKSIGQKYAALFGFTGTRPAQYQDQDLADLVLAVRQNHKKHARLLLVPHSQGNLYSNLVYDQLTGPFVAEFPPQSLLIAHIADAANTHRTGAHYVTTDKDVVIKSVRWAVAATPPSNVPVPFSLSDPLGHKFVQIYMTLPAARDAVKTLIKARLDQLRTTAPDPLTWLQTRASHLHCGPLPYPYGYPGPYACYMDVPRFAPYAYHTQNVNQFSTTSVPHVQHAYGALAELEPIVRARMQGCYSWFVSDRIAIIKAAGFVPTSQWQYSSHMHSGSCGSGFPWQTPYGNPDAAWLIHSADSSKTVARTWGELHVDYTEVQMLGVCKRT